MFTLILPSFNQASELPSPKLPALQQLRRHAKRQAAPNSPQSLIKQVFAIPTLAPNIIYAAPVWQQIGMHSLSLTPAQQLNFSAADAATLAQDLTQFYDDEHWQIQPISPAIWQITLPQAPNWQAPALPNLTGQTDGSHRPEGSRSNDWLARQTEIQMWLHQHPINQQRQAQQLPPINGIWLWDDTEPTSPPLMNTPKLIGSDSPWANLSPIMHEPAPFSFSAWQAICQEQQIPINHTLLYLDELTQPEAQAEPMLWQHTLEQWETHFFAPIWQALKKGELDGMILQTDGAQAKQLTIPAKAQYAFWHRKRPFHHRLD